ncbi:MAG: shikimate dehydrogenase [Kiritimatiellia bacterium]
MQKFAVLGHPINHSFSPVMHQASFRSIGFEGTYERRDVPPETLQDALNALADEGFTGVNLTIPHKQLALPMMDTLTPEAQRLGAVNTVLFKDGKMSGHNTDAPGFLAAAKAELGFQPHGAHVAVIGCGGAGRAIAITLAYSGIAEMNLIDIDTDKVAQVTQEIAKAHIPCHRISTEELSTVDFIAQCSPSGLAVFPGPAALRSNFRAEQMLYDIVISPTCLVTPTMVEARAAGVTCCNGTSMLVEQGALSFEFWTGLQPDRIAMRRAVDEGLKTHE